MTSGVWAHFTSSPKGTTAKCLKCGKSIKTKGGTTTGMIQHLHGIHETLVMAETESTKSGPNQQTKITQFVTNINKFSKCETTIIKLITVDGLTINQVAKSGNLASLLKYKYPAFNGISFNTIRSLLLKASTFFKSQLTEKLQELIKNDIRFSLFIDEWTSYNSRRYLNLVLSTSSHYYNLGLITLRGSLTSDKLWNIVTKHLLKFKININSDVIGLVTDGCPLMVSLKHYFTGQHVICLAHTLNLVVQSFLKSSIEPIENNYTDNENSYSSEYNKSEDDIETDYEFENSGNTYWVQQLLTKIRTLVKKINRSAHKKEFLEGKSVLLDNRIRWNSTLNMLENFLDALPQINFIILHYDIPICITSGDVKHLKLLIECLKPFEEAILQLSRLETNILDYHYISQYVEEKLKLIDNDISRMLLESLANKYSERTNIDLVNCYKFLNKDTEENDYVFLFENWYRLYGKATREDKKIKTDSADTVVPVIETEEETVGTAGLSNNNKNNIDEFIRAKRSKIVNDKTGEGNSMFHVEISRYLTESIMGPCLKQLFLAVKSIKPTTLVNERTFSVSGYLMNYRRRKMKSDLFDALIFLRYYFST